MHKKKTQVKRIPTTSVAIQTPVKGRLDAYIGSQNPRPVSADLVSIAVSRFLDELESQSKAG